MNKKVIYLIIFVILVVFLFIKMIISKNKEVVNMNQLSATVLAIDDSGITVIDSNNNVYVFSNFNEEIKLGDNLLINYIGIIDENKNVQIVSFEKMALETDSNGIPISWKDNGIFSDYYVMAYNKLNELSLDEKIGQLLLARYPDTNALQDLLKYNLSGFVFFEKDFKNKTKDEVINMISNLQSSAKIPLLTAVDEEGGAVVRVSSNSNLSVEKFKSSRELYLSGGMDAIREDTIKKSKVLSDLGLNINLAPVVDVSTDSNDYMYYRTIGEDTQTTSLFAKTVISASKESNVSYVLKHFPGYGNNIDTHTNTSIDNRSYESILSNDIPPFEEGINALGEAVLISHNIVTSIDSVPASISLSVHNLLTTNLNFTGVTITDDIAMQAMSNIDNVTLKAVLAGNNLIITSDYGASFNELKDAVNNGTLNETVIDKLVFKVLAWKYYKGLMMEVK